MDDNKLKQLLKEQSHKPGKNPWFTPRVLNRLPQRQRSSSKVMALVLTLSCIACAVAWYLLFKHMDYTVITVRDLVNVAALVTVSGLVAFQSLRQLIRSDE